MIVKFNNFTKIEFTESAELKELPMRAIVVGATPEGIRLAYLLFERGNEVIVVDDKRRRGEEVLAHLDVGVIVDHLSKLRPYKEAGIDKADIVIAIHEDDAINITACLVAKTHGVKRIIAVVSDSETAEILRKLGVIEVYVRADILARRVAQDLEPVSVLSEGEEFTIITVKINETSRVVGRKIADLKLPSWLLPLAVVKGEKLIPTSLDTTIEPNSKLIVLVKREHVADVVEVFR